MKFIIAPDKYKGSLTGLEFCDAVEKGLRSIYKDAQILKTPLADGGDGTIEVVKYYLNGNTVKVSVSDPFFRPTKASYLFSKKTKTAYVEMAEASGLKLLKEEDKNCMLTTTLGTGELIADALKKGAKEIILGIGGSATNDGGMGMAHALGFRFLDGNNKTLDPIGSNLRYLRKIDVSKVDTRLKDVIIKVSCDVTNPLYGKNGAAQIYAEQKGANKGEIEVLEYGLRNFAKVIHEQFGMDVQKIIGAGAAGGLGAGAHIFLNGQLTSGIVLLKDIADFDTQIRGADWIITGEGRLDDQTLSGKTIAGVLASAKLKNIPVAAFCGSVALSKSGRKALGITFIASVSEGMTDIEQAMKLSFDNVVKTAQKFAKDLSKK